MGIFCTDVAEVDIFCTDAVGAVSNLCVDVEGEWREWTEPSPASLLPVVTFKFTASCDAAEASEC